jgi:hypothetical protein
MPEPIFNEETEEWVEAEPWFVDVFHTVFEDDEHIGEFVTVEILPNEFEMFMTAFDAFDDGIDMFDDDTVFQAFAPDGFTALTARVNWNDGNWTGRPYRETYNTFPLTIMETLSRGDGQQETMMYKKKKTRKRD